MPCAEEPRFDSLPPPDAQRVHLQIKRRSRESVPLILSSQRPLCSKRPEILSMYGPLAPVAACAMKAARASNQAPLGASAAQGSRPEAQSSREAAALKRPQRSPSAQGLPICALEFLHAHSTKIAEFLLKSVPRVCDVRGCQGPR